MTWKGNKLQTLIHPALLRDSGWRYTTRLQEIFAARWWGYRRLADWDKASKAEKIEVLAAYEVHHKQQAINAYESAEESKRKAATRSRSPNRNRLSRRR